MHAHLARSRLRHGSHQYGLQERPNVIVYIEPIKIHMGACSELPGAPWSSPGLPREFPGAPQGSLELPGAPRGSPDAPRASRWTMEPHGPQILVLWRHFMLKVHPRTQHSSRFLSKAEGGGAWIPAWNPGKPARSRQWPSIDAPQGSWGSPALPVALPGALRGSLGPMGCALKLPLGPWAPGVRLPRLGLKASIDRRSLQQRRVALLGPTQPLAAPSVLDQVSPRSLARSHV